MAYSTTAQKVSVSLRFSRSLLFYPGVTFVDAILGRFLMNVITEIMIAVVVLSGIIIAFDLQVILDLPALAFAFTMAFALGLGDRDDELLSAVDVPHLGSHLAILNRPLFIISCIFFLFDTIPLPYRDWLWWNPLVHLVGEARSGVYSTYDASYVSPLYVFSVALITFAAGLLMLRRHYREIINS